MRLKLTNTVHADRREQATDARGLPASYTRALTALAGPCTHCDQRAVITNGAGVALCLVHQRARVDGILARQRVQRQIEQALRERVR